MNQCGNYTVLVYFNVTGNAPQVSSITGAFTDRVHPMDGRFLSNPQNNTSIHKYAILKKGLCRGCDISWLSRRVKVEQPKKKFVKINRYRGEL